MRVYIAAHTENQSRAAALRASLQAYGISCTARWLDLHDPPRSSAEGAETCWADIERADALVFLNPAEHHRSGTGGRHTEVGIALGLGKPVVLYGDRENVFHSSGWHVTHVPDGTSAQLLADAIARAIGDCAGPNVGRRSAVAFDLRRIGAAMLNGSNPERAWNQTTVAELLLEAAQCIDGQTLQEAAREAEAAPSQVGGRAAVR